MRLFRKMKKLIKMIYIYKFDVLKNLKLRLYKLSLKEPILIHSIYGKFWVSSWKDLIPLDENLADKPYDFITPKRSDTVLDLGANIGSYCIYTAKRYGSKIIAIEPVPRNYTLCKKNIFENSLTDKITLFKLAVSDISNKKISIFLDEGNEGAHSVFMTWSKKSGKKVNVKTISLKSLIKKFHPSIIKCDIEGSEYIIFNTEIKPLIKKYVRYIALELHKVKNHDFKDLVRYFDNIGYKTKFFQTDKKGETATLYAWK